MRSVFTFIFLGISILLFGQENLNIELIANADLGAQANDIWGYVDGNGTEYAIVGTVLNTQIYNLKNPSNPQLISTISGAQSIWRDVKSYKTYAYVTTDQGTDGLLVIDMTLAPTTITSKKINIPIPNSVINTCHNLYIDEEIGVLFLAGCNALSGVLAFDLKADPGDPTFISTISSNYAHDVFVQDNLVYASEINNGQLAIYDIEDIQNPKTLGSVKTTSFFTHNAWANEDNTYVFTTDEVSDGTVDAYDIMDLSNPIRIDAFVPASEENKGTVPHNTHFINDYLVTSWYTYGVVITDVSNPNKITETGHFDTHLGQGGGCWGVYPFLPSGLIIASDMANGLFVLKPNYQRASFASGKITDKDTGAPIFDAQVRIISNSPNGEKSDPQGNYIIGQLEPGTFEISFDHPAYDKKTSSVFLQSGVTNILNIELEKSAIHLQKINVVDGETGLPIEGAMISISNHELNYDLETNELGETQNSIIEGDYEIVVGQWGYKYSVIEKVINIDNVLKVELSKGYEDDFVFDYNWTNEAPNERSRWVRAIPIPTYFNGQSSNPEKDLPNDIGNQCYVTGNGIGGTGQYDVDNGTAALFSPPMDLSNSPNARLRFTPWFFNDGGSGSEPNDSFKIFAFNGIDKVLLQTIHESTNGWGPESSFDLANFIQLNEKIQIIFEASDDVEDTHLVEAAIDGFEVNLSPSLANIDFNLLNHQWSIYPNPVSTRFSIISPSTRENIRVSIYAVDGKLIQHEKFKLVKENDKVELRAPQNPGVYFMKVFENEQFVGIIKFIKI